MARRRSTQVRRDRKGQFASTGGSYRKRNRQYKKSMRAWNSPGGGGTFTPAQKRMLARGTGLKWARAPKAPRKRRKR